MVSLKRLSALAILMIACFACETAPSAAFVTPARSVAAAYAFDIYTPSFNDLSALRLDFFNYVLPQKLPPADNPFCVIPMGCRTGVWSHSYLPTVDAEAFQLVLGDGVKVIHTDAMQHGALHFAALLGIPIYSEAGSVVPAIRLGSAMWQRAGAQPGPALPVVSVETDPIPASTDPSALSYAVAFVASSFTSATDEDMTAWYLIPYVGLRLPSVRLTNYGTQPVYVDASGIGIANATPSRPGTPFSPDNFQALSALNAETMPPGAGSSTFSPLKPQPAQLLSPSDKTRAMIWPAQ
jgi:hypothetical protein